MNPLGTEVVGEFKLFDEFSDRLLERYHTFSGGIVAKVKGEMKEIAFGFGVTGG